MSLTKQERELVAVGISVAAGCRPCTHYHLREVLEAGASKAEIETTLVRASQVRRHAAELMGDWALARLHGEQRESHQTGTAGQGRLQELVNLGAAFAVNCTESLTSHMANAEQAGATRAEVVEVAELAGFIKQMATSHVEKAIGLTTERDAESAADSEKSGGCC